MKHFYIQIGMVGREKLLTLSFDSSYERSQAMLNILGTKNGYAIITTDFNTYYIKVENITYIVLEGETK